MKTILALVAALGVWLAWITSHLGVGLWILLGVLIVRYVLYLFGHRKTHNPFVSFALYMVGVASTNLAMPAIASGGISWTVIQGMVWAAAIYECRKLVTDMGTVNNLFHLSDPSQQANLNTDIADLQRMLQFVTDELAKVHPTPTQTTTPPSVKLNQGSNGGY